MGLTNSAVGRNVMDTGLEIRKQSSDDRVIAIAGNPNVGKSTVFNGLTGMKQHTGNWPGKTVSIAQGICSTHGHDYVLVDIPGTYSLLAHSAEEEVARNFVCFGEPDAVVVVCDATCLERNLNLVLQTAEICDRVLVCVNLMDEAKRKGIRIDLDALSKRLRMPVVGTVAQDKKSLHDFETALDALVDGPPPAPLRLNYAPAVEQAAALMEPHLRGAVNGRLNSRWLALRLLAPDASLLSEADRFLDGALTGDETLTAAIDAARRQLAEQNIGPETLEDLVVSRIVSEAEDICSQVVHFEKAGYNETDRRIDRLLTSRWFGYPLMLALLALIFWLTITGANYPSQLLSNALFWVQDRLTDLFVYLGAPDWLHGILVLGVYRVLAWVVSVMLPPMAIFFPLFTLLEDAGYLPRIAYNLDKPFKSCHACGKQALTMWSVNIWIIK